jgi:hypothetical protein
MPRLTIEIPTDDASSITSAIASPIKMPLVPTEASDNSDTNVEITTQPQLYNFVIYIRTEEGTEGSSIVKESFYDASHLFDASFTSPLFVAKGTYLSPIAMDQIGSIADPSLLVVRLVGQDGIPVDRGDYYQSEEADINIIADEKPGRVTYETNEECKETDVAIVYPSYMELPHSVVKILDRFGTELCKFCRELQNLVYDEDNHLVGAFCCSCRMMISQQITKCNARYPGCLAYRWVHELGNIASRCYNCDQQRCKNIMRSSRNGEGVEAAPRRRRDKKKLRKEKERQRINAAKLSTTCRAEMGSPGSVARPSTGRA